MLPFFARDIEGPQLIHLHLNIIKNLYTSIDEERNTTSPDDALNDSSVTGDNTVEKTVECSEQPPKEKLVNPGKSIGFRIAGFQ